MFVRRRTEAVLAKQRKQEEHAARLEALQDQVCIKGRSRVLCILHTLFCTHTMSKLCTPKAIHHGLRKLSCHPDQGV